MTQELIKFYENTKIKSSEVNANFQFLLDEINTRITTVKDYLENEFKKVSGNFVLPGMIVQFAHGDTPVGYLKCDGTEYLREDYPDLFAVIGTIYGSSDSTTFKVPDFRGVFLRGYGGNSLSLGQRQEAAIPNLYGTLELPVQGNATGVFKKIGSNYRKDWLYGSGSFATYAFDASSSNKIYNDDVEENRPINYAVMLCIKY